VNISTCTILGMKVSQTNYKHATSQIISWARQSLSKYVCVATVNNVMEAYDSVTFRKLMNQADLVTPDGMPVVWALRALGYRNATRVYGPDLTPIVLNEAAIAGIPVGFYGSSPAVLERLVNCVRSKYPTLRVVYAFSPPFRALNKEEDQAITKNINSSGAKILFIGLNTPKQDIWMAEHQHKVDSVMVGVGAAFDFLSGSKPQAPRWMMGVGLEWLFRLGTEPRRLWKRYLKHNPRFVWFFALQMVGLKGPYNLDQIGSPDVLCDEIKS
jgi:N-acetylglucosaminyldiphosphoundecaprenol N-acetyl-beta-D-mannosaminyltransferase